ncbi:hypothetical protein GOB87_04110 [Acetobacter estunensis]|uniref:Uncharacterized protein n=1 Tax=Acetobacter estunensis TaxID=104097 RepID=A0A967B5F6_9PROT|nr:hypothetical protein [Acetobacter estunensis]NHO53145.1 hypothetical protein [Acetobacter estunensis]
MKQIRRSPLTTTVIVRIMACVLGIMLLVFAAKFVAILPDVMPGVAAGRLLMVVLGTILLLGSIWIGV